ncbi:MAG: hypothetical protein PHG08_00555 [Bacilli bacterium]|nr:hypothetical protein [Bacilli bacterium]
MKDYREYEEMFPEVKVDEPIVSYYAYKEGKSYNFKSLREASFFSKLHEKIVENADTIKEQRKANAERQKNIQDLWFADLKDEFKELVDLGVFNEVYSFVSEDREPYEHNVYDAIDRIYAIIVMALNNSKK